MKDTERRNQMAYLDVMAAEVEVHGDSTVLGDIRAGLMSAAVESIRRLTKAELLVAVRERQVGL